LTLPRSRCGALAGVVLAAALLAGCGGGLSAGPLDGGDGNTGFCGPALDRHRVFTAGDMAVIQNPGPSAVLDRASLSRQRALRLLDAWVVPVTGYPSAFGGVGNWDGIPTQRELGRAVQWRQRRPIDGARITRTYANGGAHQFVAFDLVFVVKLVARTGGFDAVDVYYHNQNGHYHLHITNSLGLAAPKDYSRYCGSPPQ